MHTSAPPTPMLPRLLTLALLAAGLGACAPTPRLDRQFGDSVRLARAQQTLHPRAGDNGDPVAGLDAQAAMSVHDAYQRSYAAPEQQRNGLIIGVIK